MNFSWITIFYTTLLANSVFAIIAPPSAPQSLPDAFVQGQDLSLLTNGRPLQPSQMVLGGQSAEKIVTLELTNEINKFSSKIKEDITNTVLVQNPGIIPDEYLKNFRHAMKLLRIRPLTYTSQVVSGTIYHVKIAFGFQCFDVSLLDKLPSASSGSEIIYQQLMGPIVCSAE